MAPFSSPRSRDGSPPTGKRAFSLSSTERASPLEFFTARAVVRCSTPSSPKNTTLGHLLLALSVRQTPGPSIVSFAGVGHSVFALALELACLRKTRVFAGTLQGCSAVYWCCFVQYTTPGRLDICEELVEWDSLIALRLEVC